ncbi:MAG TPA: YfiR family protein, partial [Bryobacteraceae bacterium]|nr:YfiR family protein [Bryobacteraceae bacterium]
MLSRRLTRAVAIGLVPIALFVSSVWAQQPTEFEVEAAFVLNFTKFIEWPAGAFADANAPFTICILGKDPFGRALDDLLAGETVGERNVVARRLAEAPQPHACQMVFFGGPRSAARSVLGSLGGGVLTVGDGDSFLREGGMIAFVVDNRRVRFDINQALAERNGLKLSSRLL